MISKTVKPTPGLRIIKGIPSLDRVTILCMLEVHGGAVGASKALDVSRTQMMRVLKFYKIKEKRSYE